MYISSFYLAILFGFTVSLIASETFGVVPGGIIVPGYLALVCDSLSIVVLVLMISFASYALVKYPLSSVTVMYGRRMFVAILIIAVALKLSCELLFPLLPFSGFEFRGIGVIVPGLLANCYFKQGVKLTLVSTLVTTAVTFAAILIVSIFL